VAGVRYSVCYTIGNGVFYIPTKDKFLRPNACHTNVSFASTANHRSHMENRIVIQTLGTISCMSSYRTCVECIDHAIKCHKMTYPILPSPVSLFDGHNGDFASQYYSDWISSYLRYQYSFPYNLSLALSSTVTLMDQDILDMNKVGGTTANVCILIGTSQLVCANAGDSRAIIIQNNKNVVKLSTDHRPGL